MTLFAQRCKENRAIKHPNPEFEATNLRNAFNLTKASEQPSRCPSCRHGYRQLSLADRPDHRGAALKFSFHKLRVVFAGDEFGVL